MRKCRIGTAKFFTLLLLLYHTSINLMPGKPLLLTAESEDKVALQAFQFTPLCWERHAMPESDVPDSPFQSTLPCAGGDALPDNRQRLFNRFQSTPPVRGATFYDIPTGKCRLFQSTPPCAGGDVCPRSFYAAYDISIHAPLCGGRQRLTTRSYTAFYFNPRPPVRGATPAPAIQILQCRFQSTPPCAGGDQNATALMVAGDYFNPRPPARGATFSNCIFVWF